MKKLFALLLALCMVFSLAACAGSSGDAKTEDTATEDSATEDSAAEDTAATEDAAASGEREKVVIGASFNSLMNDVFTVSQTLMETWAANPLNEDDPYVDLTILVADGDTTKQISDVNDLINKGCDAILIDPVDSTAVEPAIQACKNAGIPCVTYNRPLSDEVKTRPDVEVRIGAYEQGYDTAKYCFEIMKEDGIEDINIILCNGETRDDNSVQRALGVAAACEEYGANIVAQLPCDWDPTVVAELLPAALEGNPDTNCVYVATDGMLSGVQSSLEDIDRWAPYGDENHMYIAACDLFEEGYNNVASGYIDADALMDVVGMISNAYQSAFALIRGEEVEPLVNTTGATYTAANYNDADMVSDQALWWKWKK